MHLQKRLEWNAPVILFFSTICLFAYLLNLATQGWSNHTFFCVYRSSPTDPLTYIRLLGHVFGHTSLEHFTGNIFFILLLGPLIEEKYGPRKIIALILCTAIVTGMLHIAIVPSVGLLGASGVVYALILLASFSNVKNGKIPLTFVLVAIIYLGGQLISGFEPSNRISNVTHLAGGIIGGCFGFWLNRRQHTPSQKE